MFRQVISEQALVRSVICTDSTRELQDFMKAF